MTDEPASRREFDQLSARVDWINEHGTRGTLGSNSALAVQLSEVIKDVNDLKRGVEQRFDQHMRQHEKDEIRRSSNRRWAVATVVAAVASVDGPLVTILLSRR